MFMIDINQKYGTDQWGNQIHLLTFANPKISNTIKT